MFLKKFGRNILGKAICRRSRWHPFGMVFDWFYIFFDFCLRKIT